MKKYHSILFFLLFSVFIYVGCISGQDSAQTEQNIINKVFPELFEYTFKDFRRSIPPPPAPPAPQLTDEEWDKHFENYKKHLDTLKFATLYVIVNDSVWGIPKSELKKMYDEDNENVKFIDTTTFKRSYKIDLSRFSLGSDYKLKYKSDFSKGIQELIAEDGLRHPWKEEKHLRQFSGMLSLSRIYFNKEQNYGFLNVSFSCGSLCGCGYMVFVKKNKDEWVIDRMDDLGCA